MIRLVMASLVSLCVWTSQANAQGGFVKVTYINPGNTIVIEGTNYADTITIHTTQTQARITSWDNVLGWIITLASPAPTIYAYGYDGNDLIGCVNMDEVDDQFHPKCNFYGGNGEDALIGANNEDYLAGGPHDDLLYGKGGFDIIYGDAGDDIVWSGGGADWTCGSSSPYADDGANNTLDQGGSNDMATYYFDSISNP